MKRLFGTLGLAFVLAVALSLLPGRAEADFEICNKTPRQTWAAFAHGEGGEWVSEGWWRLEAGECATVFAGDLIHRKYYFYAEADEGEWSGEFYFCAQDNGFRIVGDSECKARGYYPLGFVEEDVGESVDWTANLIE